MATAMLVPTAASPQARKTSLASSFFGKRYQNAGLGCPKCKSRIVCESEESQTAKDRWKGLAYDTSDDQQDITRGKGLVDSLFQGPQGAGTQNAIMSTLDYINLSQRTYSMDNMKDGCYIAPAFMEKLVIHITKNFLNIPSIKVPLILGIWGGKGQGKSFQCELVFAKMGINPIVMSAGELESGNAGEPAKLIRQRYREASDIIRTRGQMCALFINDLDAGAGRMGGTTQYTVNNQMVNATLMNIADNPTNVQLPGIYKKEEIPRVPIIVTGNDFSTLYAPLIRDGRMEKFYWAPTREDRIGVCKGIFKADNVADDDVVKLVDTFSGQSIDFFSALRARVYDDEVRKWIGQVGVENIGPMLLDSKEGPPVFQKPPMTINKLLEYGNMLVQEQENVKRVQLSGKYMKEAALGDANEDERKQNIFYGKAAQQIKVPVPEGCTDPQAENFDPTARSDDGTCTYDFAEKDDKETKAVDTKEIKAEGKKETKAEDTKETKVDLKSSDEVKPMTDKPKEEPGETKAEAKPEKADATKAEAKQEKPKASSDRSLPEKVLRAAVSVILLPFNQSHNGSNVYLSARKRKFIQGASFYALAKVSGFLDYEVAAAACNMLQPCPAITQEVFFDITIEGEPAGRIVVGLYGDEVPIGAKRFGEITTGKKGVSYRKRDFVKITPTYVKNSGLRTFSVGARAQDVADFTGGPTSDELIKEMKRLDAGGTRLKNVKCSVSIVVMDPTKPPAKPKLMSRDGKFELVYEESRPDPNGTEFCIAYQDAPELDTTNLVVGSVVEGMEVVEKIASTRVVQDNTNNPYFRTAKLIGDTRAVVAERGFNRPYSKIVISRCGVLGDKLSANGTSGS